MGEREFRKVAVLMGGPSAEREVSLRSGAAVADGLRRAGYEVREIDVKGHDLALPDDVEAVFIALHGEFGEDGGLQSMLDERGLPYTGSGARASQVSFDKVLSKRLMSEKGIATPAYEVLRAGETRTMPLPVVVKPARQGSTIGVHRVRQESEWAAAAADALSYGPEVIVEDYVPGRELTVGIVGEEALPVVEIVAPDGWYDYSAKYTKGACRYLAPAPIEEGAARACQELAVATFLASGCRGFARVDFRESAEGEPLVLELNTVPGFTETSLLPMAAAVAGMEFSGLCDRIMRLAGADRGN